MPTVYARCLVGEWGGVLMAPKVSGVPRPRSGTDSVYPLPSPDLVRREIVGRSLDGVV